MQTHTHEVQDAKNYPAVVEMLSTAKAVLGYDLLDLCVNGPKEKLDDTAFAQPALYVAGLAAVEKLRAENPAAAAECSMCAGLSLGEYCALTFAGVISFEDGLKVKPSALGRVHSRFGTYEKHLICAASDFRGQPLLVDVRWSCRQHCALPLLPQAVLSTCGSASPRNTCRHARSFAQRPRPQTVHVILA